MACPGCMLFKTSMAVSIWSVVILTVNFKQSVWDSTGKLLKMSEKSAKYMGVI